MTYTVKELFYTLQGEGAQAGRAAVFCRFAGCNLWSGREQDRATAECTFCDTDFIGTGGPGGGKFATADHLAATARALWDSETDGSGIPYIVCTGGEPLLQLDIPLINALHEKGFEVAVETNGTLPAPAELDWVCVSPKRLDKLVQTSGHELKLVYPQPDLPPEDVAHLDFKYFFLQPMDGIGPDAENIRLENTKKCVEYCQAHPKWRISLQTHKILGIA
ncbi:7-carboxy-7-deazaguanine synthase [Emcibacter sp.]|uniref:7-carboxy-7-deazaguanine synthase n=1 Tax=Emcibacter sp. TaxID=1979954 RepID=UPI002AA7EE9D|nr:7-carboxy-7-deazaguanine synthase [Emcibacter sp.]